MSSFISKVKSNITDVKIQHLLIVGIGMLICHVYMYVDSNYRIEPLIGICYCVLFFPMTVIFGRKWLPFQYLVVAFSMLYFNRWYNPISFMLVDVVALRHKRYRNKLFVAYGIAVLLCLFIGHRNWAHGFLHALYCVAIYFIVLDIRQELKRRLSVTDDELSIIKQIADGKEMKEIEGFCPNTVYTKLREARMRNGVKKNYQLVEMYEEDEERRQKGGM